MPVSIDTDVELPVIDAVQRGDRFAFNELVQRHSRWLRGVIFAVLGNLDTAEDVLQQVWTSVWNQIADLREPSRWRTWLYRLARNAAIDAGRNETRRRRLKREFKDLVQSAPPVQSPLAELVGDERHQMVLSAIKGLPAIYREPFILRHLQDWSYQEISEAMGLPVDTVETRLVRARRLLRDALEGKV